MKWFTLGLALAMFAGPASAQYGNNSRSGYGTYGTGSNSRSHSVDGYYNSRGTYVQPHRATNPNRTQYDNYGTRGNYNPYSGKYGIRSPRY